MAFRHALIALTCAVALPAAASAQSPEWTLAARAECPAMATTDGDALAAAVLLPPALVLPVDERADALAASVLVPDLTAAPAALAANAMDAGGCCDQPPAGAPRGPGGCQDAKRGDCCGDCDMPCCESQPPRR